MVRTGVPESGVRGSDVRDRALRDRVFAELHFRKHHFQNHQSGNRCAPDMALHRPIPRPILGTFGGALAGPGSGLCTLGESGVRGKWCLRKVVLRKCNSANTDFPDTSFARTVPEPAQAVSADMLISMHLHESCIGGFGDPGRPGLAV